MQDDPLDFVAQFTKKAEISLTPLIDVVLNIVFFLVLAASFSKTTGIQVDKVQAVTGQAQKADLMITIDKSGNYWYEGKICSLEEIVRAVISENRRKELQVVLIPDKNAQVYPLVRIMDELRLNNISRFSLGTDEALTAKEISKSVPAKGA